MDPPKSTERKRVDSRRMLDGIVFRIRSGCQWNRLPRDLGDDSTIHWTFQPWVELGVIERPWAVQDEEREQLADVKWEWQAGALRQPLERHRQWPFWGDSIGPSPTDQAKAGSNRSVLDDHTKCSVRGVSYAIHADASTGVKKMTNRLGLRVVTCAVFILLSAQISGIACAGNQQATLDNVAGNQQTPPVQARSDGSKTQGVFDDHILFGQSAAFSGPAQQLGIDMRLGILAAFHEVNEAGGIHGRRLQLESLDDGYESGAAMSNTQMLIHEHKVFALIGAVGTPTSRASFLSAGFAGVPFIAPFTGAEFLRDPQQSHVLNLRASYYQETEEMVARLTEDLGITRVAVFYQDDLFGKAGLTGAARALKRRGLEPVATGYYKRNTDAVTGAVFHIVEADPEAVIMIGAYAPVAKAIVAVREEADPVFIAVSFVGADALARELGSDGNGVYVTQVVPFPEDDLVPVVARYRAALAAYDPTAATGFVSLEGYLAGRLAIAGLESCGLEVTQGCLLDAIRDGGAIDIDGFPLQYGPKDNQGSDAVFVNVLDGGGRYRQVDKLEPVP